MIHQIQVQHDPEQDRILLRVSTGDAREFRFWLTRRFVRQLWPMLLKMLEWDRAVGSQVEAEMRRAVLGIQHEGFVQQGDFSTPFQEVPRETPLGEAPLLIATAKGTNLQAGQCMLSLLPQQGQGVDMTLDAKLLHMLTKLLSDAVTRAEWDIPAEVVESAAPADSVQTANPRRLN
jgi:hypothetical protein